MRYIFFIVTATIIGALAGCSGKDKAVELSLLDPSEIAKLEEDSTSQWDNPILEMPEPNTKLSYERLSKPNEIFNDSNFVHWAEAERIGIEPLTDARSHLNTRRQLVKLTSCEDFFVEPLTYSRPYMIPEGVAMVHEIGRRFRDTVLARGGGKYRIKVTSVLRTPENVKRLRRSNRNAIDSSVHQMATTIDITYARFAFDSSKNTHSAEDLKGVLSEILRDMRSEGKCWIKYEQKQPCFHITVRSPQVPLHESNQSTLNTVEK